MSLIVSVLAPLKTSVGGVAEQSVLVMLNPVGFSGGSVARRSWLRFHSRLPKLALPDEACGEAAVEVACLPGDWWCQVSESAERRGGRRRAVLTASVVEVPGRRASGGSAAGELLVRLPNVTGSVLLHAHLCDGGKGGAAGRFLDHLNALEAGGVELAAVRPGFWGHIAAAARWSSRSCSALLRSWYSSTMT